MSLRRDNRQNQEGDERAVGAYYEAFVIAVVICMSPVKAMAYVAPFLSGGWFLLKSKNRLGRWRTLRIGILIIAFVSFYWLVSPRFNITGGVLAIVTYSTFVFLSVVPLKSVANHKLLNRMSDLVGKVLFFEALVGIVQAFANAFRGGGFDLANGDAVQGTIHLSLDSDASFSNPIYAANLVFFLFALIPSFVSKKRSSYLPLCMGAIAFVLASVLHMILFAIAALGISLVIVRPPLPLKLSRLRLVCTAAIVPVLALAALPGNLQTLRYQVGLFVAGDLPKAASVYRAVYEMPHDYPEMPVFGLGPGQYSSRAALISTGYYFGGFEDPKSLPFLTPQITAPLSDYLWDLWVAASDVETYGGSSSAKPFFSWISVYTEFGLPAFVLVFIFSFFLVKRINARAKSVEQKWKAVAACSGILFFLLLGFQENYWEVPQAVLVGLMWIQVAYANVVCEPTSSRAKELKVST
ncbi:MAG TPA: hypothetical protein VFF95_10315 [Candidatus Binatus sp.]|nr:hypothetical protein [Candidatus Binatus sp.]